MTHEPQRVLIQGWQDRNSKETPGAKAVHPCSEGSPSSKAKRITNIQVGERFGRLTAIEPASRSDSKIPRWIFQCDCGWVGPKRVYTTVTRLGTCGRRCPFQLIDYSRNPNGSGMKTSQGYIAVRVGGRKVFEHRLVWERVYGPIPDGMQIHHKDSNPSNNDISNLQLVTQHEHQRIHAGWIQADGVWCKPCTGCGVLKAVSHFYNKLKTVSSKCKVCTKENQRIQRLKKLQSMPVHTP